MHAMSDRNYESDMDESLSSSLSCDRTQQARDIINEINEENTRRLKENVYEW